MEKNEQNTGPEKGDRFISTGNDKMYKEIRPLSNELFQKIEGSTLQIMPTQLYMHYWKNGLTCTDPNDQEWKNQAVFFWRAEEPFPKKSLPPVFETFDQRFFVFINDPGDITLRSMTAIPWFGMPGGGQKYMCVRKNEDITLEELAKINVIEYIEMVDLTNDNTEILYDRERYYFLADYRMIQFKNNNFYLDEKPIPIGLAYSIGAIHIVKKIA